MATPSAAQTMTPASGVPLEVATRRAAIVSGLQYDLSLSIPDALASPLTGSTTIRFELKDASAPLVLDFETSREHVKSIEANGKPAAINYVNGHLVIPAASLDTGANCHPHRVRRRRRAAQPQRRLPLHAVRAGARAPGVSRASISPDLKGRWTLTLDIRRVAIGGERRRAVADDQRGRATVEFRGDAAAADLSLRVRRRPISASRRARAQRPRRSACSIARPTPRRSRATATRSSICTPRRSTWLEHYTGDPVSVRQVRLRARSRRSSSAAWSTPGAIFYNASGLMLDESATQNQLLERASVDRARDRRTCGSATW